MSAFGTGFGAPAPALPAHNPNKDFEVPSPPADSVSCLAFSPVANLLVAGAWDNQVRCWDVQPSGQAVPKAATNHDQPVLCTAWSADGSTVFSGEGGRGGERFRDGGSVLQGVLRASSPPLLQKRDSQCLCVHVGMPDRGGCAVSRHRPGVRAVRASRREQWCFFSLSPSPTF